MRSVELSWSGLAATLAVLVVVVVCVRLGFWQLDRRAERLDLNAALAERAAMDTVPLALVPADTAGLPYRAALAHGVYDHARAFVLAGRSMGGTPGVHLFTPMRLADGAILVNRGWLPSPDAATVDLQAIDRPDTATVTGTLQPFPDVRLDMEPGDFRHTWFRLAGDNIRAQYPYPVAPVYLLAAGVPAGAGAPAPIPVPPRALDGGPHLSYAVQWFSFAVIFAVGWLLLAFRRPPAARPRG